MLIWTPVPKFSHSTVKTGQLSLNYLSLELAQTHRFQLKILTLIVFHFIEHE